MAGPSVTGIGDDVAVPSQRSTASPLFGRTDDLSRLVSAVGLSAAEPTGSAVLVSGDAGVGKTRLLTELARLAEAAGWRVAAGHCLDLGESSLPYLPFTEVFGRLGGDDPALAVSLIERTPALARLMPGHRQLGRAPEPEQDRMDRAQLFETVQAALAQLSEITPLLLIVEDVHWADRSTREMLSFLFARPLPARLSIVASYRSDDLHRRHPLRSTVGRVEPARRGQPHPARPARRRRRPRARAALRPGTMAERDVRDVVERAEGNAFFAEELVAAGRRNGRMLSTDLADLLLVRIDQLDESTRLVVRAASVAGRRVSHELLSRVVGLSEPELETALRGAVDGNVLVAVRPDGYAFRHALLAEAVYGDLLPGERVRLHAAYAKALAAGNSGGTAAELARHAQFGQDLPTAIRAGIQAGDEAMAVGGPDEAAHHYEVALELVTHAGARPSELTDVDVVGLTVKAADALAAAGRVQRSLALQQEQLALLPPDAPGRDRARLLVGLASKCLLTDTTIDILALTTEALPLVPAVPPTRLRAELAATRARAQAMHYRLEEAGRWATEAIDLARELDLPDVLADATATVAQVVRRTGDPLGSLHKLTGNVTSARAARELPSELRSLFSIGALHFELGELGEARAAYLEGMQRARENGHPWAPYGVDSRVMVALVDYVCGDWESSLALADTSGETAPATPAAVLAGVGLQARAGRGDPTAVDTLPDLRPYWEHEGLIAILCAGAAIDIHGDAGDLAAATAAYHDVVESIGRLWELPSFQGQIRLATLLLAQLTAEAGRVGADARAALAARAPALVEDALIASAAADTMGEGRRGPESAAWLLRLHAEHARLRWVCGIDVPPEADLVDSWQQTVAAFERFGHVFEVARSRARLAAVLRAAGRSDEAQQQAALAVGAARRLGAAPLLDELRAQGAVRERAVRERVVAPDRLDGALTSREHEVLELVAQGLSNKEIGQRLFISTKTASVHVSNILAKLGASGRTEAVALARRRGDLS